MTAISDHVGALSTTRRADVLKPYLRVDWRTGIAVVWLCVSASVSFAAEGPTDARKLLAYCEEAEKANSNPFRAGYCMAFIEGALRGWEAGAEARNVPSGYCIPSVTMGQMMGVVIKHLRADPSRLSAKAEMSVIGAFQKAFPCPAGQQQR